MVLENLSKWILLHKHAKTSSLLVRIILTWLVLKYVSGLTSETIIPLLKWSESSHGSPFISRFCISFIRSNFIQLSKLGILNLLSTEEMIRLFQDDFLDATELDVSFYTNVQRGLNICIHIFLGHALRYPLGGASEP